MKKLFNIVVRLIVSASVASAALLPLTTSAAYADHSYWAKAHGQKTVRVKEVERITYYKVSKPKRQHSHKQHKKHKKHAKHKHHKKHVKYVRYNERSDRYYRKHVQYQEPRYRPTSNTPSISFDKVMGGRIIGALLGGAAGTQFGKGRGRTVAIVGGAIIGAVIGGEVGKSMQKSDQNQASHVLENVPTGQTVTWRNPDTGRDYEMTPTKTYRTSSNLPCREYSTWVFVDGFEEQVTGRACRTPDGRWKMLS